MDKCREEFEAWIIKSNATGRVQNFIMKNENSAYIDPQTADLLVAWKASRESMKAVKLPERIPLDRYYTDETDRNLAYNCALGECEDAITSAGYKVEE